MSFRDLLDTALSAYWFMCGIVFIVKTPVWGMAFPFFLLSYFHMRTIRHRKSIYLLRLRIAQLMANDLLRDVRDAQAAAGDVK